MNTARGMQRSRDLLLAARRAAGGSLSARRESVLDFREQREASPAKGPASTLLSAETVAKLKRGCHVLLQVADRCGNPCSTGGAAVRCEVVSPKDARVQCTVADREDGTYLLSFVTRVSATYDVHITINGTHVRGSPAKLQIDPGRIDLASTVVRGGGLERAVAGKPTTFALLCKDRFGNPTRPKESSTKFEMALLPALEGERGAGDQHGKGDKKGARKKESSEWIARWKNAEAHAAACTWAETVVGNFVSKRADGDEAEAESGGPPPPQLNPLQKAEELGIKYVPKVAGDLELHVWCVRGEEDGACAPVANAKKAKDGADKAKDGTDSKVNARRKSREDADVPVGVPAPEREAVPGSPFSVHCSAGKAHAAGSFVEAPWTTRDRSADHGNSRSTSPHRLRRANTMASIDDAAETNTMAGGGAMAICEVLAGETVFTEPKIRDRLGNATAAPPGALAVSLESPGSDVLIDLVPSESMRGGLVAYEVNEAAISTSAIVILSPAPCAFQPSLSPHPSTHPFAPLLHCRVTTLSPCPPTTPLSRQVRYEPSLKGLYRFHVLLSGSPIAGSPVLFQCLPGIPDAEHSRLELPFEPDMHAANAKPEAATSRAGRDAEGGGGPSEPAMLFTNKTYKAIVTAVDRCGNELDRGGLATFSARVAAINSIVPPKSMSENFPVEDHGDVRASCPLTPPLRRRRAPLKCSCLRLS